jgi:acyl dehydratase
MSKGAADNMSEIIDSENWLALAGKWYAASPWLTVDQQMIDRFADATLDHQFIHTDPRRARTETPFGGTIAHGFLSLSLISHFAAATFPKITGTRMGINYGFENVRFLNPVPEGASVRAFFQLTEATLRNPHELLSRFKVEIEIKNATKPALAADWLTLRILDQTDKKNGKDTK